MTDVEKTEACFLCSSNLNSSFNYWSPDCRQAYLAIIIIVLIFPIYIFGVIFTSEIKPSFIGPRILGNFSSNDYGWRSICYIIPFCLYSVFW